MTLTFTKDIDEMCYPYIFEDSPLCDFEILTDELCTYIGLALSQIEQQLVNEALGWLQPKIFDLNGSIRGKCAIDEQDIAQLKHYYHFFKSKVTDNNTRFVLPRGVGPTALLHQCRSLSKKVTRQLVLIDKANIEVPQTLPRFTNMLVNFLFAMTRFLNQLQGIDEPEYVSNCYPTPKRYQKG
jgi:ATP:cob(I)alamin adenosyltransferase